MNRRTFLKIAGVTVAGAVVPIPGVAKAVAAKAPAIPLLYNHNPKFVVTIDRFGNLVDPDGGFLILQEVIEPMIRDFREYNKDVFCK